MKYLLSTTAVLAAALCTTVPAAHAQAVAPVVHVGIAGGATVPTGAFNDNFNTGWNAKALVALHMPLSPVGFRLEGAYDHLGADSFSGFSHARVWSGTADIVLSAPSLLVSPYAIGGAGIYSIKAFGAGSTVTVSGPGDEGAVTKFGWNAGAGIMFHMVRSSLFIEARYNSVMTNGAHTNFVPI
ncbi:MAG TPA: outer membrane beta-barrel protein, partial [Gemmatimonadaceae bacterium]|nr:outer membrane beta-barrel protein [Gemmatimonadaceae bacterium]